MNSRTVLWSIELGMTPVGPMLAVGDVLLVPTQTADRQHSTLYAVSLADASRRWEQSFEYALVSGLQTLRVSETLKLCNYLYYLFQISHEASACK